MREHEDATDLGQAKWRERSAAILERVKRLDRSPTRHELLQQLHVPRGQRLWRRHFSEGKLMANSKRSTPHVRNILAPREEKLQLHC